MDGVVEVDVDGFDARQDFFHHGDELSFPSDYFAIARCHRRLGQQKEAIVLYNQIKVVEKSAPEASLQIGFTYEEAKDKEKAIRTFQLTCKRYPKSPQASKSHSHLQNKYNINVTLGGTEEE